MIKSKICMLGAFAVGKTSLVQRYVHSIFSEKYHTTLGVKIDKKSLDVDGNRVELILWDLAGEDEFMEVRTSYIRGSAGVMLVADGTREETLDIAIALKEKVDSEVGEIPFILIVNKLDLRPQWSIDTERLSQLELETGWSIIETSARDSNNVDLVFEQLARQIINGQ